MQTISILGSGWLGLALARHFISAGYRVNASTTSESRLAELQATGTRPFVVNVDALDDKLQAFLQANILIVNITSKNIDAFRELVNQVRTSSIERVIFVSSTSVYKNVNKTISELDEACYSDSPLLEIEAMFRQCGDIRPTIIRFGGLFGYGRHPGRFFKPGKVVANPDSPVNLIHRDDCIGIIHEVIEQQAWGEVLNCCADTHPSKRAFYTRAVASIGGTPPTFGSSDPGAGKLISNQKVRQLLNYEFKWPDLMEIDFS